MARNSKYIDAALAVLQELGGGPIESKILIQAIVDKGLLPNRKYLYHNVLRKIRESNLFDTSTRGAVSLAQPQELAVLEPADVGEALPDKDSLAQVASETF